MARTSPTSGPIERPLPLIGELATKVYRGEKTQTRRPISALNSLVDGEPARDLFARLWLAGAWVDPGPSPTGNPGPYLRATDPAGDDATHRVYSRVQAGDRFWIREPARIVRRDYRFTGSVYRNHVMVVYDDGDRSPEIEWPARLSWSPRIGHKIPNGCIREAARTVVTVTAVRPERVQSITEEDARAEGMVPFFERFTCIGRDQRLISGELAASAEHRASFAVTWDELYADRGHRWADNGWVWVYTWEAHKP